MKKIIFIILFIIGLILGLTACLINNEEKTLELTYNTNGGVPYEWKYEIEDKNIVTLITCKKGNRDYRTIIVGELVVW